MGFLAMDSGAWLLFLLLLLLSLSHIHSQSILTLPSENDISADYCDSWMLAVEANNAGPWDRVPPTCIPFVVDYITGDRYQRDSHLVGKFSSDFAKTVALLGDGRDSWVFDIDETLLSNVPYYQSLGFRFDIFDETSFNNWVDLAAAPVLPASLTLYNELKVLGFKIFLLTGRSEFQRNATETNLLISGYRDWERLILRGSSDQGKPATTYKSEKRAELENEGYRIHGNSGDQWSDLLGYAVAVRSFKLPNPMYYIS